MMPAMHPQHRRHSRGWRRFLRHNPQYLVVIIVAILTIALVFGLMWFITSPDYAKPRS